MLAFNKEVNRELTAPSVRERFTLNQQQAVLSFLLMIMAGWVHRHQLIVIDFFRPRAGCSRLTAGKADPVYRRGTGAVGRRS